MYKLFPHIGLWLCLSVLIFSVELADADQIKALDKQGNTLSMLSIADGSSALLKVSLTGEGSVGATVVLLDAVTKEKKYSTVADSSGLAQFPSVSGGTYIVEIENSKAAIMNVAMEKIEPASAHVTEVMENSARISSRTMYAGGAAAAFAGMTAGTAFIIANNRDNGSSNEMSPF